MRVRIRTPAGAAATTGSVIRRNARRSLAMPDILALGTDKPGRTDITLRTTERLDRPITCTASVLLEIAIG
jgi:hypothetical protein